MLRRSNLAHLVLRSTTPVPWSQATHACDRKHIPRKFVRGQRTQPLRVELSLHRKGSLEKGTNTMSDDEDMDEEGGSENESGEEDEEEETMEGRQGYLVGVRRPRVRGVVSALNHSI